MLAEDLEDDPGNATRFAWLARTADAPPPPESGPAKTSLVFWGMGSGASGWLVSCLAVFAFAGVNLTRIESRPLRRGMGEYMFFLDLEGSAADPAVAGALDGPAPSRRVGSSPRLLRHRAEVSFRSAVTATLRIVATAVPPGPLGSVPPGDHPRHGPEADGSSSRWSGGRVLVLNATYEPINVCTVRRATVLLLKSKAEVVEVGTRICTGRPARCRARS